MRTEALLSIFLIISTVIAGGCIGSRANEHALNSQNKTTSSVYG